MSRTHRGEIKAFPQSVEAERALLGGLIKSPKHLGEVAEILTAEDLHRPEHARLFVVARLVRGSALVRVRDPRRGHAAVRHILDRGRLGGLRRRSLARGEQRDGAERSQVTGDHAATISGRARRQPADHFLDTQKARACFSPTGRSWT